MPPITVDPARFTDKPFTRRRTWPDRENDYVAIIDGMRAGRITLDSRAGNVQVWGWSVTRPCLPPELNPGHGHEDTLEAAQEAFKAKFWQWHRWAMEQPGGVTWMMP